MKPYSMDLRERVVAACDEGGATRERIAARFSVSVSWIRDLMRRRRETGSIAPRPRGGGRAPAFDGATNAACFEAYVGRCLVPALRPGDVVVMDNLACHKTAEVARLIGAAGAVVRYLPAYSPDLNPIERLFSKLKVLLRRAKARTVDALIAAMGGSLRAIRPGDIAGWFRHSGYAPLGSTARVNQKMF